MTVVRRPLCFVVFLTVVSCGCGSRPKHPPGPVVTCYLVEGSVRIKGAPAEGVRVFFRPVQTTAGEPGRIFDTLTDTEGTFTCTTNVPGDGLPSGRYAVTFTWPETLYDDPTTETDRLMGRFSDPRRPPFHIDVKASDNVFSPFEIE